MDTHAARFPGIINDPTTEALTDRQAERLAAVTRIPAKTLAGKTIADLRKAALPHLDPTWFLFRTICGRVVKTDAAGVDHPVPFATVNVYDTDLGIIGWSPPWLPYSWFYPLYRRRHLLATVTTDECGRFCVRVPRWEIDWYVRWRAERQCYSTWLRRPDIRDVLVHQDVIPKPDPGPLHIDDHLLVHAARVLAPAAVAAVRGLASSVMGAATAKTAEVMATPAFSMAVRPPLDKQADALLSGDRTKLAARLAIKPELLKDFDPRRFYGPFLRCKTVIVPQWQTVLDIPDLTFEVTQDVDGDGDQEIIYSEGLFDVRWDAAAIPDLTLHATSIAIATASCDAPKIPSGIPPAILFAGNYPLKQATLPSTFQDGDGFSVLVNRPDLDGDPATPARVDPAQAPFTGSFDLWGQSEVAGATHYRIAHQEGSGASTYLLAGFGPLQRLVSSGGGTMTLQVRNVAPEGHWYPIVAQAENWIPYGKLAPVIVAGNAQHAFRLELGTNGGVAGGPITPVAASLTAPVKVEVDTTRPDVVTTLAWRHPDLTTSWTTLPLAACPVVVRDSLRRVEFQLTVTVSANHLRNYAIGASGCGGPAPVLISGGPASHWHTSPGDNSASVTLIYSLAANSPAGCYHFAGSAHSRAFDPMTTVALAIGETPEHYWQVTDNAPLYTPFDVSVAIQ